MMPTTFIGYDCIIFYRWFSPDGTDERGRIMARLVTELLEKNGLRVWLDQRELLSIAPAEQVIQHIVAVFRRVSLVIILAAPGDWRRFSTDNDIHRWEWELSLESEKPIWLLQHGLQDSVPCSSTELAKTLLVHDPRLADLARKRDVNIRFIYSDMIDGILKEVSDACKSLRSGARSFFTFDKD